MGWFWQTWCGFTWRVLMSFRKPRFIIWAASLLLLVGCQNYRNVKKLESALGVRLPGSPSNCFIWTDDRPDYNYMSLEARFDADERAWRQFCESLQLHPGGEYLPFEKMPPAASFWWDVPQNELQLKRASRKNSRGIVTALWWKNHIYVEFDGYPPAWSRE